MFDEKMSAKELLLIEEYDSTAGSKNNYSAKLRHCELIFKLSGKNRVKFDTLSVTEKAYTVRYLPTIENANEYFVDVLESGQCIDIYFTSLEESPLKMPSQAFIADFTGNERMCALFVKALGIWKKHGEGYYHKSMAVFYEIIAELNKSEKPFYFDKRRFGKIIPAEEYIENNIFSEKIDCSSLHGMCNCSYSYFKRLFLAKYGMPPSKYVIKLRLDAAKEMLSVGRKSVSEISCAVGYPNASYFSRLFKANMGCSAMEYRKRYL